MPWLLTLCAEAEAASQAVAQVQGCVLLTYDHGLTAWTVDDILHFIKGPLKKIAACAIDIILFSMEIVHSIQKYLKIPQQAAQTCFLYFSGKYHSKQHRWLFCTSEKYHSKQHRWLFCTSLENTTRQYWHLCRDLWKPPQQAEQTSSTMYLCEKIPQQEEWCIDIVYVPLQKNTTTGSIVYRHRHCSLCTSVKKITTAGSENSRQHRHRPLCTSMKQIPQQAA